MRGNSCVLRKDHRPQRVKSRRDERFQSLNPDNFRFHCKVDMKCMVSYIHWYHEYSNGMQIKNLHFFSKILSAFLIFGCFFYPWDWELRSHNLDIKCFSSFQYLDRGIIKYLEFDIVPNIQAISRFSFC